MSRSKAFLKRVIILEFGILFLHLVIALIGLLGLEFKLSVIIDISLFFLFGIGAIIVAPSLDREPVNFINRFLILTTLQLLSAILILGVFIYLKASDIIVISIQFIFLYIVLLAIQSFFLIRGVNNQLNG